MKPVRTFWLLSTVSLNGKASGLNGAEVEPLLHFLGQLNQECENLPGLPVRENGSIRRIRNF